MRKLRKGFYAYLFLLILFAIVVGSFTFNSLTNYRKFIMGNNAYQIGDYGETELNYKAVVSNRNEKQILFYNLGNTYYQQGRYKEASKYYWASINLSKGNSIKAKSYYNLGLTYFRVNNLDKSVEAFKKSLMLQPTDNQTRLNLIYAVQQLEIWTKKQEEKSRKGTTENESKKKGEQDGEIEKDENSDISNETESMLNLVMKDEQQKKLKIGKMKRKLNNLSKDEKDY